MAPSLQLAREYKTITENPPPYIIAHPSESNILEWHYILTGPEDTPYHGGQYWGTLTFPPNYPFAPPAIRMHTPSGRFQPSSRLCLSISDFHPKSFNPAWEVSTILIGLLSFMTSNEMTTGSVAGSPSERKFYASRSRWWNSTGGGSHSNPKQKGNLKAGDGGAKFRSQWPELDKENWEWIRKNNIDPDTGYRSAGAASSSGSGCGSSCGPAIPGIAAAGSGGQTQAVVDRVVQQRDAGQGLLSKNKFYIAGAMVLVYLLLVRLYGDI
ncbi:hypothetical protein MKZ38_004972 [Zalerion maritima]|uniref:UBC core domain-containing protein n=1 Tax=Zalerion maritima TaxID=339359 RepID=A0AAD5RM15_9PEZI|nr:hypothetical protein MKZ38_004972 [Zalerion maritima]